MARTEKTPEPIAKRDLQRASARLRSVLATFERAIELIAESEVLAVNYGKSLERGLQALEGFEPELRIAIALYEAGTPNFYQSNRVSEIDRQSAEVFAQADPALRRAAKKTTQKPIQSKDQKTRSNKRGA